MERCGERGEEVVGGGCKGGGEESSTEQKVRGEFVAVGELIGAEEICDGGIASCLRGGTRWPVQALTGNDGLRGGWSERTVGGMGSRSRVWRSTAYLLNRISLIQVKDAFGAELSGRGREVTR